MHSLMSDWHEPSAACPVLSRPNNTITTRDSGNVPLSAYFGVARSKLEVDQDLDMMIPRFPGEVQGILVNID